MVNPLGRHRSAPVNNVHGHEPDNHEILTVNFESG